MKKTIGPKFTRALHFDFHTSPGIKNICEGFDAETFASQLESAHVEYINFAARCNMGYSYYNTAVGKKYEGLGDRDLLAEVIEACHKRGIGVTAYFNVGLDHELGADNRNWLKIDRQGRIYREDVKSNFFRVMCYNSPYRQHFLAEIQEVSQYDIDGIFCDCFNQIQCFCPECVADMNRKGIDVNDDRALLEYQNSVCQDFVEDIYRAVGEKKDRIKLFFNGLSWYAGNQTHAELECLTSDAGWGYDYFDSMAAYARTLYEDRVYMSGRFQNSWGDFGGIKTLVSMQNDLYDAMMNSYAISYGDHLHPVNGFEKEVASRIGKIMEEKLLYEPYVDSSENLVDVGIIIHSDHIGRAMPFFAKGAVRMFRELKIPFNIYDETGKFDEDKIRLLIIGNGTGYDQQFKDRLRSYAEKGGKILFTADAIDLGKELGLLDYIELVGNDSSDNAYFTVPESDMRWAMYFPSRIIRNIAGTETAKYVDKIMNFDWDGRQSCFYRPQGLPSEYSAAVIGDNTACVCFDIFSAYASCFLVEHRELVDKLIGALLPDRLVEAPTMPKTATIALTQNAEHTVFHIKSTYPEQKMGRGIIEEHIYMRSVPVSILGTYQVFALPGMTPVESRIENGRTLFETGDLLGYKAFLLK